jgi:hypothetical protein
MLQISVFFTVTTYIFSKVPNRRAITPDYKEFIASEDGFFCILGTLWFFLEQDKMTDALDERLYGKCELGKEGNFSDSWAVFLNMFCTCAGRH